MFPRSFCLLPPSCKVSKPYSSKKTFSQNCDELWLMLILQGMQVCGRLPSRVRFWSYKAFLKCLYGLLQNLPKTVDSPFEDCRQSSWQSAWQPRQSSQQPPTVFPTILLTVSTYFPAVPTLTLLCYFISAYKILKIKIYLYTKLSSKRLLKDCQDCSAWQERTAETDLNSLQKLIVCSDNC